MKYWFLTTFAVISLSTSTAWATDCNNNGIEDLTELSEKCADTNENGKLDVCENLYTNDCEISMSSGGSADLTIKIHPGNPYMYYACSFSFARGTFEPNEGTILPGTLNDYKKVMPLKSDLGIFPWNPDFSLLDETVQAYITGGIHDPEKGYFNWSWYWIDGKILERARGYLDGLAQGRVTLHLPPGLGSYLVGHKIYGSCGIVDPGNYPPHFIGWTNAAGVTIVN